MNENPHVDPRLETVEIIVQANARTTLAVHGSFVHILAATGEFNLYINNATRAARLQQSLKYRAPAGKGFTVLTFEDLTGAANTIRFAYGEGDFFDDRTSISGGVTISGTVATQEAVPANVDDAADVTLNNGAETALGAAPANARARVLVSDPANTVNVRIGKTGQVGAARGALLQPGQSLIWPGSAQLYAYAAAAGQKISQTFVVA